MKSEKMYDDQSGSMKKKRHKEIHIDKQSNADGDECIREATPLDYVPESKRRKKHKKKKHKSEDDADEECKKELGDKGTLKEKYLNVDVSKKKKTHDREHATQSSSDLEVDDRKIKVKKKRKKDKNISTDASEAGCDNEPLKKKRKSQPESSASEITQDAPSAKWEKVDSFLNECKKEKSKKKQKVDTQPEACVKTTDMANLKNISSTCEEVSANHHKKKKKHSKHKETSSLDDLESSVHLSKHESNSALTCDSVEINNRCVEEQEGKDRPKKKHKSKKSLGTNVEDKQIPSSICEEENGGHQKKEKKHSKQRNTLSIDEQKKKQKNICDSLSSEENIKGSVSQAYIDKTKSIVSSVIAQDKVNLATNELNSNYCEEESIQHHKKQKKHSKSRDSSLVDDNKQQNGESKFSSESPSGQTHLKKPAVTSACTTVVEGQWQGNLFESSERQNKFLRLMGGMKKSSDSSGNMGVTNRDGNTSDSIIKKKGLFKSLTSLVNTSNTAMSATSAASLNQNLEEEYNRAMNFKLSGKVGTGFGFVQDPAEKKTFHIDIHKSKSIKFDDD